jgi:hypothetical protein
MISAGPAVASRRIPIPNMSCLFPTEEPFGFSQRRHSFKFPQAVATCLECIISVRRTHGNQGDDAADIQFSNPPDQQLILDVPALLDVCCKSTQFLLKIPGFLKMDTCRYPVSGLAFDHSVMKQDESHLGFPNSLKHRSGVHGFICDDFHEPPSCVGYALPCLPDMLKLHRRTAKMKKYINYVKMILSINLASEVGSFRNI